MDDVLHALADPSRRSLLEALRAGPATAGEVNMTAAISVPPSVMVMVLDMTVTPLTGATIAPPNCPGRKNLAEFLGEFYRNQ